MLKCSSWALCGLLDVVHTSFGRLMGREHVNCAAGPHAQRGTARLTAT